MKSLPVVMCGLGLCCGVGVAQPPYKTLIEDGHYLRARPLVERALANNPTDVDALISLSKLEMSFQHMDAGVAAAERAVAAEPGNASAHAQLAEAIGLRIANSSVSFLQKIKSAWMFKREADKTLQMDPDNVNALSDMAYYYFYLPGIAGGDKKRAESLADKVIGLDPVKGSGVKAALTSEEPDKAKRRAAQEAIWRQAVAVKPLNYEAHFSLGDVYFGEGPEKRTQAEIEGNQAVGLNPGRIWAYTLLAAVAVTQDRWADVEVTLQRARAAVPDDRTPEFQTARFILQEHKDGHLADAERYLRDYLSAPTEGFEPSWASAHWRLGLVLEREGRKAEAVKEVRTAVDIDGNLEGAKKDLKRLN